MLYAITTAKSETTYSNRTKSHSFVSAFFQWAAMQDKEHHLGWTGICLLATAAVLFPLTMTFILLNGAVFSLMIIAMIALVVVMVLNFASMPTRYTIPAFVLGIAIDIAVILTSIFI
ncbi:MAG: hypothetical protein ABJB86_06285 [Bacteroidota bacterium]